MTDAQLIPFPRPYDDKHLRSTARAACDAWDQFVATFENHPLTTAEGLAALQLEAAIGDLRTAQAEALARSRDGRG